MYHEPVLLQESVAGLNVKTGGTYVDVTFGGGGHSKAILALLGQGRLIAFDRDAEAIKNHSGDQRLQLLNHNFKYLKNFLRAEDALPVDGILADLGVSSHQLDTPGRGFSPRFQGPLDLRMTNTSGMDAASVLNSYEEDELAQLFRMYGEIRNAGAIARAVVRRRKTEPFVTTEDFTRFLTPFAPPMARNKLNAKAFQALRIEVNGELEALRSLLEQSLTVLKPGGRLVVISYHSLEDRLVKNFMRSGNFEGVEEKDLFGNSSSPFIPVTRKAIVACVEELASNPRSRSAKLRIAEKK